MLKKTTHKFRCGEHFFTPLKVEHIDSKPDSQFRNRHKYWTLKIDWVNNFYGYNDCMAFRSSVLLLLRRLDDAESFPNLSAELTR